MDWSTRYENMLDILFIRLDLNYMFHFNAFHKILINLSSISTFLVTFDIVRNLINISTILASEPRLIYFSHSERKVMWIDSMVKINSMCLDLLQKFLKFFFWKESKVRNGAKFTQFSASKVFFQMFTFEYERNCGMIKQKLSN